MFGDERVNSPRQVGVAMNRITSWTAGGNGNLPHFARCRGDELYTWVVPGARLVIAHRRAQSWLVSGDRWTAKENAQYHTICLMPRNGCGRRGGCQRFPGRIVISPILQGKFWGWEGKQQARQTLERATEGTWPCMGTACYYGLARGSNHLASRIPRRRIP